MNGMAPTTPRWLIGFVAALLVARPVVGDGGPGTTGSLVLSLGWFVALVAWAAWNAWRAPGLTVGGWASLPLILTALVVAVRVGFAPPVPWMGLTAAWDVVTWAVAFVAVRQVAADRRDAAGLYAALCAAAVAAFVDLALPRMATWVGATLPANVSDLDRHWCFWAAAAVFPAALPLLAPRTQHQWGLSVPLALVCVAMLATWNDAWPSIASARPTAALAMATANPGGGVGPGIYDRFAARYTLPDAHAVSPLPMGSYLGLAASCGWPVAVLVILAIVAAIVPYKRGIDGPPPNGPRWEVYFGGIVGLLIGFVLQVGDLKPAASLPPIRALGAAAAVRALVWFATFAAMEAVYAVRANSYVSMCVARATVGCITILGLWCDFLGSPALALTFWALAALALNLGRPPDPSAWARSVPGRLLPLLAAAGLPIAFVVQVFAPGYVSASALRLAHARAVPYADKVAAIDAAPPAMRSSARKEAGDYAARFVLPNLARAVLANPRDPVPRLELSAWWLKQWEQGAGENADANAVVAARVAQELDPESTAGLLAEFAARCRFAELMAAKREQQFTHLDRIIGEVATRDPARETRLRYEVARIYFAVGDTTNGKTAAARVKKLDDDAPGPRYKLTDAERAQVAKWLGP